MTYSHGPETIAASDLPTSADRATVYRRLGRAVQGSAPITSGRSRSGATIAHAEHVAGAFRDAGSRAACVGGGTPIVERDSLIADLADGRIELLTSCDPIS